MMRSPCYSHFEKPCIVYSPDDKEFAFIDQSNRYKKTTCSKCKWKIAESIKFETKKYKKVGVFVQAKLPERLKMSKDPFVRIKIP